MKTAVKRSISWVRSVHPLIKDGLLAAVLAGTLLYDLSVQELPPGSPAREADALGYVLVALLVLPLAFRTRFPVGVFVTILGVATMVALLFYRPTSFGFGLIAATYTVARWCSRRVSLVALSLGLAFGAGIKLRAIAAGVEPGLFAWPLDAVYFGAAWFLGESIQARRRYATQLEKSRESLAERALAAERTRIARELHDAVGHSVNVMVLHAGGGEQILDRRPEEARRAFRSIASVGRAALAEMDRLIGLLRSTDDTPELLRPSLTNLDRLADEFRELGLDVTISRRGAPVHLSAGLDLSAFRIVQEALTNTLKHAGRTRAEVSVAYSNGYLVLSVTDDGGSPLGATTRAGPRSARGLIGMRERAALFGGELSAGPLPEGGYGVTATLPIESRDV